MKLHYYPGTDSLYIELKDGPGVETGDIVEGLVVDFDDKRQSRLRYRPCLRQARPVEDRDARAPAASAE
ncbi:MAG: hypothetical protein K0S06_4007 [Microvirga sp.]|jgi:hypothetical protein|nr:hypothetical protein [Microvirga sp.]